MKRLVVCCDGTWDTLRDIYPTNVVKLARAISSEDEAKVRQLVYYDEGIGSNSIFDRLPGGALGIGLERDISDAYAFLCLNYEPNDEIYLFGFSRGAYTIRCLAQLINDYGILNRSAIKLIPKIYWHYRLSKKRDTDLFNPHKVDETSFKMKDVVKRMDEKERGWRWLNKLFSFALTRRKNPFYYEFEHYLKSRNQKNVNRKLVTLFFDYWFEQKLYPVTDLDAKIHVLGCFDTVVQVGIPDITGWICLERLKCNLDFRNNEVNGKVILALHALAIDEQRRFLRHTVMKKEKNSQTVLKQVWFAGNHGCVGSGSNDENIYQMANIALNWTIEEIATANLGLKIDSDRLHENDPLLYKDDYKEDVTGDFQPLAEFQRWEWLVRVLKLDFVRDDNNNSKKNSDNLIHQTVCQRLVQRKDYRPQNLPSSYKEKCLKKYSNLES